MLPHQQLKTVRRARARTRRARTSDSLPRGPSSTPVPAPPTRSPTSPIVRVITPNSGFDWGDAGIGAAGGLALAMLGLGGTLALSHRTRATPTARQPRPANEPPATANTTSISCPPT